MKLIRIPKTEEEAKSNRRAVYDFIKANPKLHEQSTFANPCGTTMCIAGTAAFLAGARFVFEEFNELSNTIFNGEDMHTDELGAKLLGYKPFDEWSHGLFYDMNNESAMKKLKESSE